MNKIKFSHRYRKLPNYLSSATLLAVQKIKKSKLPKTFIAYDTDYQEQEIDQNFRLEGSEFLLLVFWTSEGLFTTVRPAYPTRKEEYYKSKVGENFEILINS